MKPGPVIAMVVLILLGCWLVLQPALSHPKAPLAIRIGAVEIRAEMRPAAGANEPSPAAGGTQAQPKFEYRVVSHPDLRDRWISSAEYEGLVDRELRDWMARPALERTLLGFLNITSWWEFGWIVIGLGGQIAFFGRMMVQWVVSEKARESVVPTLFWWLSLGGSICLFAYFVWRVDFVGVLGQSTGIVIYIRNLRLISKQKRREARRVARGETPADVPDRSADPMADPGPEPTSA